MGYVKEKEAESLVRTVTKSLTAIDCAANQVRGTPAGIPRYGAASRRLTYAEGAGQASAQRVLCVLVVKRKALAVITWHISSAQHPQTRTQTKKRWGPALWLWKGLVALARAKLRKPQSKIRPHKEKKKRHSKHGTHKAANKKAACRKEKQTIIVYTAKKEV